MVSSDVLNVVITGSTRGIGLGLAREYLRRGHRVLISGRKQSDCDAVASALRAEIPAACIESVACDVTDIESVEALWRRSVELMGRVDHWINNAGRNNPKARLEDIDWAQVEATVDTNLLGVMRGSAVAFRGMRAQGSGWIFNMEGFGSEGMIGLEQVPYGVSKYGLRYVTKALVRAAKDSPVKIGYLSPGIVTTQMAVPRAERRDQFFAKSRKFLNMMADHVETVTPWMVDKMLTADKNGVTIRWMGAGRAVGRLLSSLVRKRTVIEEAIERLDNSPGKEGNRS